VQHLMFKAFFELAKDRADFISLVFMKPRPPVSSASIRRVGSLSQRRPRFRPRRAVSGWRGTFSRRGFTLPR
jgi:hypothetical protein